MNRLTGDDPRDYLDYREGSGGTVEIFDLAVNSERGKGKGRAMVERLLALHDEDGTRLVWAITRIDNLIAQSFYEALGFRVVAVLRQFYQDSPHKHADAVMFGKDIPKCNGLNEWCPKHGYNHSDRRPA